MSSSKKINHITDPSFVFIFTINLDGKIDIDSKIRENILIHEKKIKRNTFRHQKNIPRERFYRVKNNIFYDMLCKCDRCKKDRFILKDLGEDGLDQFISKAFLNKSVLASWEYNCRYLEEALFKGSSLLDNIIKHSKDRYIRFSHEQEIGLFSCSDGSEKTINFFDQIQDIDFNPKMNIKLFSTGSISILITFPNLRLKSCGHLTGNSEKHFDHIKISPEHLISLIKSPNLAARNIENPRDKGDGSRTMSSGFFNILAFELASHIFNEFFRCLSHERNIDRTSTVKILRVIPRIPFRTRLLKIGRWIIFWYLTNFFSDPEKIIKRVQNRKRIKNIIRDEDQYSIVNRFRKGKYTQKVTWEEINIPPECSKLSERVSYIKDGQDYYIEYRGDLEDKDILLKQYKKYVEDAKKNYENKKNEENKKRLIIAEKDLENINSLFNVLQPPDPIRRSTVKASRLWNAPLYVAPYVGVILPSEYIYEDGVLGEEANRVLIAIANQTEEFVTSFEDVNKYVKGHSLFRGSNNAALLERRGFAIAYEANKKNKHSSVGEMVKTLIFCMESIFSTTKSVSNFNKELEEFVSREISN